jgi:2-keto-4-pentenoate hydratase/2-oxohepta-3-ene-1,7-dioic acid hydratase in catechol pathway
MQTIRVNGELTTPSKIVCVGRNYVAHIEELGNEVPDEMVVFNKPNSALRSTLYSHLGEPLHYEGEICFAIDNGEFCAVGFGLDLTKRQLQSRLKEKGLPWERAKSFDGAVLLSEFVPLPDNPDDLNLVLTVGGAVRQVGGVDLMMYKPAAILRELKSFMSLESGDVVMTGTPAGVGVVHCGECFRGQILMKDEVLLTAQWQAQ